jgi:hypothetical protein
MLQLWRECMPEEAASDCVKELIQEQIAPSRLIVVTRFDHVARGADKRACLACALLKR